MCPFLVVQEPLWLVITRLVNQTVLVMECAPCATYPKMFLRVCRFQIGKAAKYSYRSKAKSSQSSHKKPPKSPYGGISHHFSNESCRASNSVWKIGIISLIWSTQSEPSAKWFSWISRNCLLPAFSLSNFRFGLFQTGLTKWGIWHQFSTQNLMLYNFH